MTAKQTLLARYPEAEIRPGNTFDKASNRVRDGYHIRPSSAHTSTFYVGDEETACVKACKRLRLNKSHYKIHFDGGHFE